MATKLKYDKWKTQDIKNWKFDVYSKTGEWLDHWNMPYKELRKFYEEMEEALQKHTTCWVHLYKQSRINEINLCWVIDGLKNLGYITCLHGEMDRNLKGELTGESSLMKYEGLKDYQERAKKEFIKDVNKRKPEQREILNKLRVALSKVKDRKLYVKELMNVGYSDTAGRSYGDLEVYLPDNIVLRMKRMNSYLLYVNNKLIGRPLISYVAKELDNFKFCGYKYHTEKYIEWIKRNLKSYKNVVNNEIYVLE